MVKYMHGVGRKEERDKESKRKTQNVFKAAEKFIEEQTGAKPGYDRISVAMGFPGDMPDRKVLETKPKEIYENILSALSYHLSLRDTRIPKEKIDVDEKDAAELGGIATKKDYRLKGCIKILIEGMIRDLKQKNKKVVISTSANYKATHALQKMGWEKVAEAWDTKQISKSEFDDMLPEEFKERYEQYIKRISSDKKLKEELVELGQNIINPEGADQQRQQELRKKTMRANIWFDSKDKDIRLGVTRMGDEFIFMRSNRSSSGMFRRLEDVKEK